MSTVIGGKLKLKGSKDSKAVKKPILEKASSSGAAVLLSSSSTISSSSSSLSSSSSAPTKVSHLTASELKHLEKKAKAEDREIQKKAKQSYTERLDGYNKYLSTLPAHNDIPKISAAGNG